MGDSIKESHLRMQEMSKATKEAYSELGLSAEEYATRVAKGGADGNKAFQEIVKRLMDVDDATQRNALSVDLFGTQFEDLREKVVFAMVGATKEITGLEGTTKRAADAIHQSFGTKLKKVWRDMQSDIEPIGEDLLKIAKDVLPKAADAIGKMTKSFAEMSPQSQKTVIALAGIAAAAGPMMIAVGGLTSGVGLLMKGIAPLATALGGGVGLAGVFSALTGPVGLAAVSIGIVTAGVIGLSKATEENNTVSFKSLQARQKEIDKNDELIKNYDALKKKNELSNDEMLRFLDIQSEIASTASPDAIKALKDEQGKLLEKSGLTNEEMQNFLKYNDLIIQKAPNTTKAISDQGNAYADNSAALKEVNAEKLESLKIDAEKAITDNISKETELLKQQKEDVAFIKEADKERGEIAANIFAITREITGKEREIEELKKDRSRHGQEVLAQAQQELETLKRQIGGEEARSNLLLAQMQERQKGLDASEKELKKLDEQKFKFESIILATVGLNAEKGKGLAALDSEIGKLNVQKLHLQALHESGKLNTSEYQRQVREIDTQLGKLAEAQTQLKNVNALAGKTVYKSIQISTNPSIEEFERRLTKPGSKHLNITTSGGGRALGGYATGTRYSAEGLALVGEEGPELMYLPSGTRVIPNGDTEAILRNWNIPMMASGGVTLTEGMAYVGERGRELVDLRGAATSPFSKNGPVLIEIPIYLDSNEIGRGTSGVIDDILSANLQTKLIMNGVR